MDIATQLKIMLANQELIMRNQVRILAEHRANYGLKTDSTREHIEAYEQIITQTNDQIKLTRETRKAL